MPGSDPESGVSAAAFWRPFAVCVALLFAAWGLNVLVDPTGEIGLAGSNAFNRTVAAPVVTYVRSSSRAAAYRRTIATTSANIFLIGTSREARGFDLCDRPDVLRIAGSSWGIRDMAEIERLLLETRSRPATLLIAVGLPSDSGRPDPNRKFASRFSALSPGMTLLSVETMIANIAGGGQTASREAECRPLKPDDADWRGAAARLNHISRALDSSEGSLRRGTAIVQEMAGLAERICAQRGIRHRIVFFSLPATPALSGTGAVDQLYARNTRMLAADINRRFAHGACRILYADFVTAPPGTAAEQRNWTDRANWTDFTHFSPQLGRVAFDAMLQRISAGE